MKESDFIKRLKKELPQWIAKGWINPQFEQAIIGSVSDKSLQKPGHYILALFGLILILSGIISFFAANWSGISKLVKLLILFAGIFISYSAAGYFYTLKKDSAYLKWIAELLLLLGVGLFGTDIFLISQIYHIDAHFPNGLLIWSLGAWLVAVLMASPLCMLPAIILGFIWSFTESMFFLFGVHWAFLGMFLLLLFPVLKFNWKVLLHVLLIGFIIWLTQNFFWLSAESNSQNISHQLFYTEILILSAAILLNLAVMFKEKRNFLLNPTIEHYALFCLFLFTFFLSFPDLLKKFTAQQAGYTFSMLFSLFALALMASSLFIRTLLKKLKVTSEIKKIGIFLSLVFPTLVILSYLNLNTKTLAIVFNIILVGMMVYYTLIGYEIQDRIYINISFLFFAFFIVARYFDIFWSLLNRSIFYVIGGGLLIYGSVFLEKKRRKLTQTSIREMRREQ